MIYIYVLLGFLTLSISTQAQEIVFSPQWIIQSQFAGFYTADSLGYYEEEGLDITIKHLPISETPIESIKNGECQIITLNLLHALHFNSINKDSNKDLVNIMQLSQNNSLMMISRFPLKDVNSLKNQTIAAWRYIDSELLKSVNTDTDLNINWIQFNGGVNILLSGAVDILLITKFNEYHLLEESGWIINPKHIIKFSDSKYNIPEEGVYVTKEYYNKNKDALQKFAKASKRGWEWAEKNRKQTVNLVMTLALQANLGTNRYHQRMMLNDILYFHLDPNSNKRTYHLSEKSYNDAIDFLSITNREYPTPYQYFVN